MGNMENCLIQNTSPIGSEIIQESPLTQQSCLKQKKSSLNQSQHVKFINLKQNLPNKVQFFYMHPLQIQIIPQSNQFMIFNQFNKENSEKITSSTKENVQKISIKIQQNKERILKDSKNKQNGECINKQSQNTQVQVNNQTKIQQDQDSLKVQIALKKVSVQWNTFAKIKKKSYLQDYIFIKQIGRGAYGSVCKIKMKYGGLLRAAKIIKVASIIKQKNNQQKFLAEIALPIQMDHPNIIKLYQVFQWKKQFILVMELCQGGDLFQMIKQNKIFTQNKASQIMKQILSAIFYMHKKNIMHRDIKPQNMLYDIQSRALKIIDFGTAIKFKPGEKVKNTIGTPYYLAPEVIKGQYDQKSDVWSCGVILYILLSGYPPFNGKNQKEIMQKITMQPLQFNNNVWNKRSSKVKQLIQKMLKKKPQQRLSAQQALNSQWINDTPTQLQQADIGQQVCGNLKSFQFQNKLKAVVYTYIASQLYSNKDKQVLLKAFRAMDKDGNGVIGKQQLIQVFNKNSTSSLSSNDIQKILAIVDTNGSGLIDFTEFLVAASNEEKILQRQRLQNAFNYLDTDHSGSITMNQVKQFLDGSQQTNMDLKKIFDQVDDNGDGQISKKQFIALLLRKT